MEAQVIHARLEVDRIRSRYPYRRPIARLAPHAQGREPLIRVGKAKLVSQLGK